MRNSAQVGEGKEKGEEMRKGCDLTLIQVIDRCARLSLYPSGHTPQMLMLDTSPFRPLKFEQVRPK